MPSLSLASAIIIIISINLRSIISSLLLTYIADDVSPSLQDTMQGIKLPDSLPAELKAADLLLKRAKELKTHDPVMCYWCCYRAAQIGVADKRTKEGTLALLDLLDALESMKSLMKDNDAVTNEIAGQAYVENFALKVFATADDQDREGKATPATVRSFLAAATFIEVGKSFGDGELDAEMEAKLKYARFKAASLSKAFKAGVTPQPGPPATSTSTADESTFPMPPPSPPILPPVVDRTDEEESQARHLTSWSNAASPGLEEPNKFNEAVVLDDEADTGERKDAGIVLDGEPPSTGGFFSRKRRDSSNLKVRFAESGEDDETEKKDENGEEKGPEETSSAPIVLDHEDVDDELLKLPSPPRPFESESLDADGDTDPSAPSAPPFERSRTPSPAPSSSASTPFPSTPGSAPPPIQPISPDKPHSIQISPLPPSDLSAPPQPPDFSISPSSPPSAPAPREVKNAARSLPTARAPAPPLPPPPPPPPAAPAAAATEPVELTIELIERAQKHARWAISALNYEDGETARKELREALRLLG